VTLFDLDDYLPVAPPVWMIPVCIYCNEPLARIPIDGGAAASWGPAEKWSYLAVREHLATCPACPPERRPEPHACAGCPDP
jgi:hypothetical protein